MERVAKAMSPSHWTYRELSSIATQSTDSMISIFDDPCFMDDNSSSDEFPIFQDQVSEDPICSLRPFASRSDADAHERPSEVKVHSEQGDSLDGDDDYDSDISDLEEHDFDFMASEFFSFLGEKENKKTPSNYRHREGKHSSSGSSRTNRSGGILTPSNGLGTIKTPSPRMTVSPVVSDEKGLRTNRDRNKVSSHAPRSETIVTPRQGMGTLKPPNPRVASSHLGSEEQGFWTKNNSSSTTARRRVLTPPEGNAFSFNSTPSPKAVISPKLSPLFSTNSEPPSPKGLISPKLSPLFSSNIESRRPTSSNREKETPQRVKPSSDDPYQWAYDVWRAKGLMGRDKNSKTPKKRLSPRIASSIVAIEGQPKQDTTSSTLDICSNMGAMVVAPSRELCAAPPNENVPKEHSSSFASVLAQWRQKSDEVPNSHFLSPDGRALTQYTPNKYKSHRPASHSKTETPTSIVTNEQRYDDSVCTCSTSIFSGNDDLVDFFLPKLGMACICGRRDTSIPSHSDPTYLEHILRPWQVEFLRSFGIRKGDQLVKAHHRSAGILARGMRSWRRKNRMTPVRTVSCGMALHIWSRTCKVYVRSVRAQWAQGRSVVEPPSVLEALSSFLETRAKVPSTRRHRKAASRPLLEAESQAEI